MKHFCYISSFSLYTTKTQSTHYQQHTQTHRNLQKLKKMDLKQNYNPQKRDFCREKVLFSPSLPLKSLRNTGAEQPPMAYNRRHCAPSLRRKTRFFWWRHTPSVERSTTISKNSSAFYSEQTTFRQKSSSFLTKWPRGKRAPPTLCRNNVGGAIDS